MERAPGPTSFSLAWELASDSCHQYAAKITCCLQVLGILHEALRLPRLVVHSCKNKHVPDGRHRPTRSNQPPELPWQRNNIMQVSQCQSCKKHAPIASRALHIQVDNRFATTAAGAVTELPSETVWSSSCKAAMACQASTLARQQLHTRSSRK